MLTHQLELSRRKKCLANDNHHVKKLGVYTLPTAMGLLDSVDASLLEPHLQILFPEAILSDIENFRKEFSKVFGFALDQGVSGWQVLRKHFSCCSKNACNLCDPKIRARPNYESCSNS